MAPGLKIPVLERVFVIEVFDAEPRDSGSGKKSGGSACDVVPSAGDVLSASGVGKLALDGDMPPMLPLPWARVRPLRGAVAGV